MTDAPRPGRTLGMVLKGYPRISETFISNEIRLLEQMGFRIHIYSMRAPRENFTHASVKEIRARVTYLPESMLRGLPTLLWHNLRLMLHSPRRYWRCVRLMLPRFRLAPKKHTWLKHLLQGGYIVQKSILDDKVDIGHLHGHFAHTPTTVTMCAACLAGVPFSFTAHAKDIYTQDPRRIEDKLALAEFVVTCTRYNARHLQAIAPEGKPVHCVYHGINLDLFSPEGRAPEAAPPYRILTVARFVEKKGLDTVLKALALLRKRGLDFRFTLVGQGKKAFDRKVRGWVEELGLGDVTDMPGTVAHDAVIRLLHEADCFTLGCRRAADGDRDGIPNVVAEAMATGVPVAATDISGVPELIAHERTGLLCAPDDPEGLADIIGRALTDQELRRAIIPAALEKVRAVFDNKRLIRELGEIYIDHGVPCPGRDGA